MAFGQGGSYSNLMDVLKPWGKKIFVKANLSGAVLNVAKVPDEGSESDVFRVLKREGFNPRWKRKGLIIEVDLKESYGKQRQAMSLREDLKKLAAKHPEMREHLVPLLKQAGRWNKYTIGVVRSRTVVLTIRAETYSAPIGEVVQENKNVLRTLMLLEREIGGNVSADPEVGGSSSKGIRIQGAYMIQNISGPKDPALVLAKQIVTKNGFPVEGI